MSQPQNTEYADYYHTMIWFMKDYGMKRIFIMGTIAKYQLQDLRSIVQLFLTWLVWILTSGTYHNVIAIQSMFEKRSDINWTVYHFSNLTGSHSQDTAA